MVGIGSNLSNTAVAQTTGTATLIVDAQVINDNGGSAQASDLIVCIVDYGGTNPEPQCFPGSESGTAVTLQTSGQGYAVDQQNAYDLGYLPYTSDPDCVFFVNEQEERILQPGETYYCTIFFDDGYDGEAPQVTFKVEDGKGKELSSGSSTTSKSIEIKFTATDNIGVTSVECSLDGPTLHKEYSPCTSPIELSNLKKGFYIFSVTARDAYGNEQQTYFSWTVK